MDYTDQPSYLPPLLTSVSSVTQANRRLFVLRSADMQSVADQSFTKLFAGGLGYVVTDIRARTVSGSASTVSAGGIYTGASKSGLAVVPATQLYIGLSALGKLVTPALATALNTDIQTATPILSLTTASATPCLADFYIMGFTLD